MTKMRKDMNGKTIGEIVEVENKWSDLIKIKVSNKRKWGKGEPSEEREKETTKIKNK